MSRDVSVGKRLGALVDIAQLAAVGVGLYLVYQIFQGFNKVKKTAISVADQTGELFDTTPDPSNATFASWYDPTQRIVFFYVLTFPDGSQHTIWANNVYSDGTFIFSGDGGLYRIGNDKSGGLRAYAYSGPADATAIGGATPGDW